MVLKYFNLNILKGEFCDFSLQNILKNHALIYENLTRKEVIK